MLYYTLRRLIYLIPILIGVTFISFSILYLTPGDPAQLLAGVDATEEDLEAIRIKFGLKDPFYLQYVRYLLNILKGDLGESLRSRRKVTTELWAAYPATLELASASMVVAIIIGLAVGIISAVKQNSLFDYGTMTIALFGVSMPIFWLGLMLMLIFSLYLGWLPSVGRGTFRHLIMPSISLGTASAAIIARMTRSSLLEVIRQDYIMTARAKGLAQRLVILKHALKNALIPVVTIMGVRFGALLSGAVLTETVFAWPGVGRLMIQSIYNRDFPVVQGALILVATNFVLVNLLVDLLYGFLNPRVRYE